MDIPARESWNRAKGTKESSAVSDAFVENSEFLRRYLGRFVTTRHEAEDIAQEAYIRAFVAEKKTRIKQPKAFLFQVARNVALTRLAKKTRQIHQCIDELSEPEPSLIDAAAEDQAEALQLLETYCDAIMEMSPKCRDVFLLRKVYGYKHREIAQLLGMSISSVEKYVRRGILVFQDYLAAQYESGDEDNRGATLRNFTSRTLT